MRIPTLVCLTAALAALSLAAAARPALAAREQDVKEALSALEQAVKDHPKNAELHVDLAFAYKKLGRVDDAQAQFEAAVADDPTKAEAHYMLGLIYEKKALRDKAVAAWQACLAATADPGMKETAQRHLHVLAATKH